MVLSSLTVQGWTIPALARHLRLQVPPEPEPTERHDLSADPANRLAFFGYRLTPDAPLVGSDADALRLPGNARPVAVPRESEALAPETAGKLTPGDSLYVLAQKVNGTTLRDLLITPSAPAYLEKRQFYGDFVLRGDARMASVAAQYDLPLPDTMAEFTLAEFLASMLRRKPGIGDRVRLGKLEFMVRTVANGRVIQLGLRIPTHLDDRP